MIALVHNLFMMDNVFQNVHLVIVGIVMVFVKEHVLTIILTRYY